MRIALVVPGGVHESGEIRVIPVLLWLIERLGRSHEIHVFALDQYPGRRDYVLLGASVHNLGSLAARGAWRFLRRVKALRDGFRRHGPFDLIHAFWAAPSGALAALALGEARTPLVVTLAGGEFASVESIGYGLQLSWQSRTLVKLAIHRASRMTGATKFTVGMARDQGEVANLVPLGVDRNTFELAGAESTRNPGPPFRLLAVGSLNRVKNYPMMLRAFRRVLDAEPHAQLDIVGEDTLVGAVQRLALELGIAPRVTFHGFLKTRDLIPLYRRSHLLVHTSWHEAGQVVALEAGMTRLACIGSAVGYVADWYSGTGLAVAPNDDAALATAILRVLSDRGLRARIAEDAYAFAVTHDADYTADAFMAIYEDLRSRRPSRL